MERERGRNECDVISWLEKQFAWEVCFRGRKAIEEWAGKIP
jgi:hypothetical protein